MTKIISNIQLLLIGFIIILLPLFDKEEALMYSYKYSPLFWLVITTTILLISSLFLSWKKKITITKIDILFTSFFVYKILYNLLYTANNGSINHYSTYSLIFLFILYISLKAIKNDTLKLIPYMLVISMALQCIIGECQLLGFAASNNRLFNITGSFFNPAILGGFISIILPITIIIYKEETKRKWLKNALLIIILISIIVLPATKSRAAIITTVIICGYLYLKYFYKKEITKQSKIALGISPLIILGGLYFLKKDSANGRIMIWTISSKMVKDKPILGHGPQGFEKTYMLTQADYFKNKPDSKYIPIADNTDFVYNEILKITIQYGLVGLILFLFLFVYSIKVTKENKARYALIALFIFGLFSYPSDILYLRIITIILLVLVSKYDKEIINIKAKIFLPLLIIPILTAKPLVQLHSGLKRWYIANLDYNLGNQKASCKEYKAIANKFSNNGDFLIQYGKNLSMIGQDSLAVETLTNAKEYISNIILYTALGNSYMRLGKYNKSEISYVTAKNMVPNRFLPLYLLAKLYFKQGDTQKLKETYKEMETKDIKVSSSAIDEMKKEIKNLIK